MDYKHYIKIDENNNVISNFSSAFKQPDQDSILVADTNERHFHLLKGLILDISEFRVYNYVYINGTEYRAKTQTELDTEINILKNSNENKLKKIKEIVDQLLVEQEIKGVNNLYNIQEVLHASGKNKKDKKIQQSYIEDLGEWVEELLYLDEDLDLSSINYDDINKSNKAIFKDPPVPIAK